MSAVPPFRIGMLTPSSNTVLEPYTAALLAPLFPRVTAHFGRFRVTRIGLDPGADAQFSQEPILAASDLLADAKVDLIAWNGTSASWLGIDTDERLCAAITARCGVPATSAVLSLRRYLAGHGITRIGLVTPYTSDVQARIVQTFARDGITTVAERHLGVSDNFSFATVPEGEIADLCRAVAVEMPQAIVVLCTNMRGTLIAADLEAELGVTVLDSVAFTLWGCFAERGLPTRDLAGFGRLFA
ncbi:maleate cis-trans isomerase family protein [Chthonobacter rhizosphaerae]|uniref:maleate cis-trans isomerase family protein n=1 Tax=Chthonobacter rhizosphaerae TaxID=2735553 RepID=UPI0015EE418B|nr:aspartate/glutamate racemase family protein [Chthonobacter rhizosphaerae]